jgi:tetratricopeptide (TPR) repeat protein
MTTATAAPAAPAPAASNELEQACHSAFDRKNYKDVLDSCGRAFDARPDAADLAALVAESEINRGRAASSLTWARKALAIDPNLADAYAFVGTAEQQAGHAQAAKTAYLRYLELAPSGRFAQDLKAIVATR